MSEKEELVDVYDENKCKTNKIIKRKDKDLLDENEFILAVHCWIINFKKEILITRRSLNKNRGGMWEDTHGGVQSGETSIQAMRRELQEEIGLDVKEEELKLVRSLKRKNIFRDCYVLFKDIDIKDISFNDNEVMDCKYVSLEKFEEMIKMGESTFKDIAQTNLKELIYECKNS